MVDTSYFRQGWAAGFGHYPNCPPAADTSGEYSSGYAAGLHSGHKLRGCLDSYNMPTRRASVNPSYDARNAAYAADLAYYRSRALGLPVTVRRSAGVL